MPTLTPGRTDAAAGKITIAVTGMTCDACSARVQGALQRTPGVKDAVVNLMTNSATVAFDRTIASPDSLVETVRATGYDATLPPTGRSAIEEQAAQDRAHAGEDRVPKTKALASLATAIIAMALSRPLMRQRTRGWMHGEQLARRTRGR